MHNVMFAMLRLRKIFRKSGPCYGPSTMSFSRLWHPALRMIHKTMKHSSVILSVLVLYMNSIICAYNLPYSLHCADVIGGWCPSANNMDKWNVFALSIHCAVKDFKTGFCLWLFIVTFIFTLLERCSL